MSLQDKQEFKAYKNLVSLMEGDVLIYQRPNSKRGIWQCVIKISKRPRERFSTGVKDLDTAKQIALNRYQSLRTRLENDIPIERLKWDKLVAHFFKVRKNTKNAQRFNKAYFDEYFSKFRDIRLVTSSDIIDYWEWRINYWLDPKNLAKKAKESKNAMYHISRKPNIRTLKQEANALKNIFQFAKNEGLIAKLPNIEPPIGHKNVEVENKRGWFQESEYRQLRQELMIRADPAGLFGINRLKKNHRKAYQHPQDHLCWLRMRLFVLIIANTGIRPGELLQIRWRDWKKEYLPLSKDNPKLVPFVYLNVLRDVSKVRKPREVFFRNPDAAWRWREQFKELKLKLEPYQINDDDLIFNGYFNRDKPAQMSIMFRRLLDDLGLREQPDNPTRIRVLYSLRSFYITYQLTHNTGLPIHLLALQCGTSTKMIEKNYSKAITRSFRQFYIETMADKDKRKLGIYEDQETELM